MTSIAGGSIQRALVEWSNAMRILGLVLAGVVAILAFGVSWIGNDIYGETLKVDPACHDAPLFTADSAKLTVASNPLAHQIDPTVYGRVQSVSFPSRDGKVEVAGLLSPPPAGGPLVIATHGFTGCKHHKHGLSIIGILASAGYGVLAIDLREHGESTVLDGVAALGSDEFSDVLGARDYAIHTLGLAPSEVGFWGESMGGATTLIANTHEDLGPLFLDAPFADIKLVMKDNSDRASVPRWTIDIISSAVSLWRNYDFTTVTPLDGLVERPEQAIFWVHGTADETVGFHHAEMARDAVASNDRKTFFVADGIGHVATLWDRPSEYRLSLVSFFDAHLKD